MPTGELERQRQQRKDEERKRQEANAVAQANNEEARESTQIARPPSRTDMSATNIESVIIPEQKQVESKILPKISPKIVLSAAAAVLAIVLVLLLVQQASSGSPLTITTTPPRCNRVLR